MKPVFLVHPVFLQPCPSCARFDIRSPLEIKGQREKHQKLGNRKGKKNNLMDILSDKLIKSHRKKKLDIAPKRKD